MTKEKIFAKARKITCDLLSSEKRGVKKSSLHGARGEKTPVRFVDHSFF